MFSVSKDQDIQHKKASKDFRFFFSFFFFFFFSCVCVMLTFLKLIIMVLWPLTEWVYKNK